MTSEWPMGQKIYEKAVCVPLAVNHSFKSARLEDGEGLRRKDTLKFRSAPVKFNQVKTEFSLQNSSHRRAFRPALLFINIMEQ